MGSYLGTIFALPDSLFAGAVPAAAAAASVLSQAALPVVPDTAAAQPPAAAAPPASLRAEADAETSVSDAERAATPAVSAAAAGDAGGSTQQQRQQNGAQPATDAGEPVITCRACDVGAREALARYSNSTVVATVSRVMHALSWRCASANLRCSCGQTARLPLCEAHAP